MKQLLERFKSQYRMRRTLLRQSLWGAFVGAFQDLRV